MRFPFALSSLFLCSVFFVAGCAGQPKKTAVTYPWKIPSNAYFQSKIPPAPANDSETTRQDLKVVLALQAKATPAKIAQAQFTYNLTVFTFGEILDMDFKPAKYPETSKFFIQLNALVNHVNTALKNHFKREHPFQVDPKVKEYVVAPPGYSYPSYHSARCEVFRHVLMLLDPGHKAAFDRAANEVEQDRVFAGEHFPSDIQAGNQLGRLIWEELKKDKNFMDEIARIKATEWTPPPRKLKH